MIVSNCPGEEFDHTELSGLGVDSLEYFVGIFLRQRAEQSSASFGRNFIRAESSFTFPISTPDPPDAEPEGNFQPLCDYLENKTAKSRDVLINLSTFRLSRPVIYTENTFRAWTDFLTHLS